MSNSPISITTWLFPVDVPHVSKVDSFKSLIGSNYLRTGWAYMEANEYSYYAMWSGISFNMQLIDTCVSFWVVYIGIAVSSLPPRLAIIFGVSDEIRPIAFGCAPYLAVQWNSGWYHNSGTHKSVVSYICETGMSCQSWYTPTRCQNSRPHKELHLTYLHYNPSWNFLGDEILHSRTLICD